MLVDKIKKNLINHTPSGPEIIFRVVPISMAGNDEASAGHSNLIPVIIFWASFALPYKSALLQW